MRSLSLITLVSLLALALPSVQAYATTGCYPSGLITLITISLLTRTTSNIASPSACAARSKTLGYKYAYYDGSTRRCYSTNVEPLLSGTSNSIETIIGGVGPTVCRAGDLQGLDVTTPYTDVGCALPSSLTAVHPSFGLTNPLSISSCLRTCNAKGFRFSYTTNLAVGNTCQCSSSVAILNSDICGLFRSYVYVNKAVPAPSGARKRLLEQIKRSENLGLCPAGLQSCRVGSDSSDDYECIDVQAELESCGGCTVGILDGAPELATSGVDCTALPGVGMGAVTCVSGQCQVSQCKHGFTLVDNTCVSTRSVAAMALNVLRLQAV